jgi:tetratricopeptide (TPR) repeat protein
MAAAHRPGGEPHPLFGRDDLLAEVDRALARAREGRGEGLLLTGPGGIGKTESLRAATERARGWRVLSARALPDELPSPFALVRELAASLREDSEAASPPSATTRPLPLSELFPSDATPPSAAPDPGEAAARTAASDQQLERLLAPLGKTSIEGLGAIRDRLYTRLVEYFLGLAQDRPLLIAVDDLQAADASSRHFLELLAPELPRARVLLLATVSDGADATASGRELLDRIGRRPPFRTLPLRPLAPLELGELVASIQGGDRPSPDELVRWQAQTEGNPLLVEQLARSTPGRGLAAAGPRDRAPARLLDVLLDRARSLPEPDRRVLAYATVLGREFDFGRLEAVVGSGEERVTEALDRLVQAGLLRERGGEIYEFVSEAVRGALYAELTETRRRILHRKVAEALEAHGGTSDFELARQFYLGRHDAQSVEYNLRAAEAATRAFAFDQGVTHLARALESERRRPDRDRSREIRLLTEEGRLLGETGDFVRAEERLDEAVGLAREGPAGAEELGRAVLALAWAKSERSDYRSAERLAREAYGLLEADASPRDRMAAHRVLGIVYWRMGDLVRAEPHQRAALEIAEREGTPIELGHALVDVANVMTRSPERVEEGLAAFRRAAELFREADDPSGRSRALMNTAVFEYSVGRTEEAFRDIAVATESAERARSPLWTGYCQLNLAQWEADRGRIDAAQRAVDRAELLVGPLGDRLAVEQVVMTRGMVAELRGEFDAAERLYQEALGQARELHLMGELAELFVRLARLSLRRRDIDEARRRLAEADLAKVRELRPDLDPMLQELEARLAVGTPRG